MDFAPIVAFLDRGGPALWAIALLSVLVVALILWKLWRFARAGVWSGASTARRVEALCAGAADPGPGRGLRARFVAATLAVLDAPMLDREAKRDEIARLGARAVGDLRPGLRGLELIAAIAPLIGLLGTVLGMIDAFQALEATGTQADASVLAGGIWEALLTTAAGMAVAIPATVAQSGFEALVERVQGECEDDATRLFAHLAP